jgi:hypothetical protein
MHEAVFVIWIYVNGFGPKVYYLGSVKAPVRIVEGLLLVGVV